MDGFWSSSLGIAIILLAQGLALIVFVMLSLVYMVYGDRKIWAAVQMRRGP
nr:NADH-quinone oxidoreductase subunit H [Paracoccus sp. (in: a-proteobacteria)]